MKRIDKAYELFPMGIEEEGELIPKTRYIEEYCPYNLINGIGEEGNYSGEHGYSADNSITFQGCKGITCIECWNKEL